MRPHIKEFVGRCSQILNIVEPIVEIGSKRFPAQDKLANLRTLFAGRLFVGCDMDPGPGVDRIEFLEKLTFKDGEVGTFILCDTLEHVRDIDKAMGELSRCLDPQQGILIATSVMLFPVHGFPNDYWRFTPEGFRHLARHFGWVATFYGGDPNLPHTVAVVASHQPLAQAMLERLAKTVSCLSLVPHIVDAKTELIFTSLSTMLVEQARSAGKTALLAEGQMGVLSQEGWILTPGAWIRLALPKLEDVVRLELQESGRIIQAIELSNLNILVGESVEGLPETAFQLNPMPGHERQVTQLEAYLVYGSGEKRMIARSGLGVLLPQADLSHGLTLHSVDHNARDQDPGLARAEHAAKLVNEAHVRGEKVVLDLGCGFRKAGNIGIDAKVGNNDADIVCLLGFEPLPFEEASVDEVVCRDFLEHIPKAVYLESEGKLHYPVIYLIDEVWRVLKPGGIFRSWTPMYPHPEVFQDPTHLSAWTIKSMDYFCGIYPVAQRTYEIRACFEKLEVCEDGFYLFAKLMKPKM
jgi:Methyltransferase domain